MNWLSRMFPWPAKHERRAAIRAAKDERHQSQATAAQSRIVRQQIVRLARANHYSEIIEGQVMRGHREGGGGRA